MQSVDSSKEIPYEFNGTLIEAVQFFEKRIGDDVGDDVRHDMAMFMTYLLTEQSNLNNNSGDLPSDSDLKLIFEEGKFDELAQAKSFKVSDHYYVFTASNFIDSVLQRAYSLIVAIFGQQWLLLGFGFLSMVVNSLAKIESCDMCVFETMLKGRYDLRVFFSAQELWQEMVSETQNGFVCNNPHDPSFCIHRKAGLCDCDIFGTIKRFLDSGVLVSVDGKAEKGKLKVAN